MIHESSIFQPPKIMDHLDCRTSRASSSILSAHWLLRLLAGSAIALIKDPEIRFRKGKSARIDAAFGIHTRNPIDASRHNCHGIKLVTSRPSCDIADIVRRIVEVPSPLKRTVSPKFPPPLRSFNPEIIYACFTIAPLLIAPSLYRFPLAFLPLGTFPVCFLAYLAGLTSPSGAWIAAGLRESEKSARSPAVRTRPPPFAHCILPLAAGRSARARVPLAETRLRPRPHHVPPCREKH